MQSHRTVWAAVDAAGGPEADRVDRGKENLPEKVLMEPTLQEAQRPHVLLLSSGKQCAPFVHSSSAATPRTEPWTPQEEETQVQGSFFPHLAPLGASLNKSHTGSSGYSHI